ncbi:hypothetical protein U0070_015304 [Myodes glareolus]|uniref:Uncharacterized protein n=1 Tax=Myodes glareolus TaxID=447135 RepID=A0AAW0JYS6_MYOGA
MHLAAAAEVSPVMNQFPGPWTVQTASCCLRQRRARATEAVLKKRAVLQAGVNTATTLVEAKRARQVLAAHDGALSGCCSSCLSHVANWGGTYCVINGRARLVHGRTRTTEALPC